MSDLYRSAIQARLAKLPTIPHESYEQGDEGEEETDSIGDLPSKSGSTLIYVLALAFILETVITCPLTLRITVHVDLTCGT